MERIVKRYAKDDKYVYETFIKRSGEEKTYIYGVEEFIRKIMDEANVYVSELFAGEESCYDYYSRFDEAMDAEFERALLFLNDIGFSDEEIEMYKEALDYIYTK